MLESVLPRRLAFLLSAFDLEAEVLFLMLAATAPESSGATVLPTPVKLGGMSAGSCGK